MSPTRSTFVGQQSHPSTTLSVPPITRWKNYGPDGSESVDLDAGDFVYVPPRTTRRVVNPTEGVWEIVVNFVGTGPPAVSADGPRSDDE